MIRRPPRSTLFPSTPLSRSRRSIAARTRRAPLRRAPATPPAAPAHRTASRAPPSPARSLRARGRGRAGARDRKSTRLNSSHSQISYAVFCLKKKKKTQHNTVLTTPPTRFPTPPQLPSLLYSSQSPLLTLLISLRGKLEPPILSSSSCLYAHR